MKQTFYDYKKIIFVSATMIFNSLVAFAQNANVTINTNATSNGSWSGGTAGPYVFTPSANSANVLNSEIVSRLVGNNGFTKANVTIQTACVSCSENGNITVSNAIIAAGAGAAPATLTFNAQNNVSITANLTMTGANGGGYGTNVSITSAAGNITLSNNAAIVTNGGQGAVAGVGGTAGSISINTGGAFAINAGSSMTANGGAAGLFGGTLGAANNMSITGTGGIRLAANLTATGSTNGDFILNDGNPTVTTGGGVNDGQTAGVINGRNLVKLGAGTLVLSSANTYNGSTTITAGKLRPTTNNITVNNNGPFGNNAGNIFLNGGAIESAVTTFTRPIIVSASGSRLDAYGDNRTIGSTINLATAGTFTLQLGGTTAASAEGQTLTLSGVISNSTGTLVVNKVGNSIVTVSAANNFTGGVNLIAGTLNINNAAALGGVAGIFKIEDGTTINNSTGAAITTSNYPINFNGNFTFTGTQALNLGAGAVTLSNDVQITTTASTLTMSGVINNAARSLTKAGAGTLAFTNQAITINNLTINEGTLTASSGNTSLAGNFTNNATFANNNGTVILNGSTTQTIGGSTATTFRNLTINNTSPVSPQIVLANSNSTVNNTLTLTQGNIDARTNSRTLIVSNNAVGAIARTAGYIIGNLQRAINTGSLTYTYPIGTDSGSYTPADIIFNNVTIAGTLIGSATAGDHPNTCSSNINVGMTANNFWAFASSGITYTNYGASFTYPSADLDNGVTAADFISGKYTTGTWSYPTLNGTPSTTSIAISGQTSFGDFIVGNTPTNSINYIINEVCDNVTTSVSVSITGALDGVFSSSPAGLSIDSVTGTITPTLSTAGVYIVSYDFPNAVCTVPTATTTVTIKAAPTATLTNTTGTTVVDCNNTQIAVTASGGDSYAWSGGSSINTAANTFSLTGAYTATVSSVNGCFDSDSVSISVDTAAPTINIINNSGGTTLTCTRTQISVAASGGVSYSWSGGDSTNTAGNTFNDEGSYTVTMIGNNGCVNTNTVVITYDTIAPTAAILNNTGVDTITCTNPLISVTASGGVSYLWSGGDSTNTADNTFPASGSYTVTVTGANGCIAYESISLGIDTVSVGITNNTGISVIDCNNSSISLTATGGDNYSWSGGSTPNSSSNTIFSGGTYTVTATLTNGCNNEAAITINQDTNPPVVSIINNTGETELTCSVSTISVTATGGVSYSWSGGNNTNAADNTFTSPGNYIVSVTGSNGCSDNGNIIITQNITSPTVSINNVSGTSILTCAVTTITVSASGADTYMWSGGDSTNVAGNVFSIPATYTVTGTDTINGCEGINTISITIDTTSAQITNNTGTTVLDCNNTTISVTATGGSSYSWSGGDSANTAGNIFTTPGTYSVTVVNTNGCNNTAEIFVTQDISTPTVQITNNTGKTILDCNTTVISVTAAGGVAYVWTGGSSTNLANNTFSQPGTYSVNVTGANGCSSEDLITITKDVVKPALNILTNGTTELNCSVASVNFSATGTDTYVWSGGNTPNSANNTFTVSGTYTVIGTNSSSNFCKDTAFVAVTENRVAPVIGITNNTGTTVLDCNNTSISLTATGTDSYIWSGGLSTNTAANSFNSPNSYTLVGTDNTNQCKDTAIITLTQDILAPNVKAGSLTGPTILNCSVTSIVLGAIGADTYVWSAGNSLNTYSNTVSTPNSYTVTGTTTSNGCSSQDVITITKDITPPTVGITNNTGATILDCNNPVINVTATGAVNYIWTGGSSTNKAANSLSLPTSYTVTGTAANGCTNTANITLTQDVSLPIVSITNNTGLTELTCTATSIQVTASGATSYVWSGGSNPNSSVNTFTAPGTYSLTGTNTTNGCTSIATISLTQDVVLPTLSITNNTGVTLLTNEYPFVSVTASGNGLSYAWSGGIFPSAATNTLDSAATYTVTTIGTNGCTNSRTIQILKVSAQIELSGGANPSCAGDVPVYSFAANTSNAGGSPIYQWRVNGNPVGSNTSSYTATNLKNGDVVDLVITVQSTTLTSNASPITIVINPVPDQPTITQNGATLMSSSTINNQWYFNGVEISGATAQFYAATEKGFYSVKVSNGACVNTSPIFTDIEDVAADNNSVTIYPNPFAVSAKVSFGKYLSNAIVNIVSVSGETIKQMNVSGTEVTINKDDLSSGVYFIQVIADVVYATQKVIIY